MIRRPPASLLDLHDALLLDLDGTLMHGSVPIPHAADAVDRAREQGVSIVFATNNASRTPQQAADHLATVGVTASPEEMATSPQIAASLLARRLEPGSTVLVVGGESLAAQIRAEGLTAVMEDSPEVVAVVQGWSPDLDWAQLAEGAYAIRRGAFWMATNVDATLPTEKGMAPGNGSMVAALRHASGAEPAVAGKPEPGMFEVAAQRVGSRSPLAIGDRLDTDIEGANRAGIHSLLVLTGVSSVLDALRAHPIQRPTYVMRDLSTLHQPFNLPVVSGEGARCGRSNAQWDGENLRLTTSTSVAPLEDLDAICAALALLRGTRPNAPWTGTLLDAEGNIIDGPATQDAATQGPAAQS